MRKFIITSLLVAIITVIVGCGGTLQMKADYQERPAAPGALRVCVEDFYFNDGPGHALGLNRAVAEGNYAPWLKKVLAERGAAIVNDKAQAQVIIIPQRIEFNVKWSSHLHVATVTINGSEFRAEYRWRYTKGVSLMPLNEEAFREMLEGSAAKIADHVLGPAQTAKTN